MSIKILQGADKAYGITSDGRRVEVGEGAALILDTTPREDGSKPVFEVQTEGSLTVDFDATKTPNVLVIR